MQIVWKVLLLHNIVVFYLVDSKYYADNEEIASGARRRPPFDERRFQNDQPQNSREFSKYPKYEYPTDRDDGARHRTWDDRGLHSEFENLGYQNRRADGLDWDRKDTKRQEWDTRPKGEEYKPVWDGPKDKQFNPSETIDDKQKGKVQSFSDKGQETKNFQKMNCDRSNERFESCFAGCAAVTCDNPSDRMRPCYPFCEPGCICVHPYVRDDRTHKCVLPRDCTRGLKGIPDLGLD